MGPYGAPPPGYYGYGPYGPYAPMPMGPYGPVPCGMPPPGPYGPPMGPYGCPPPGPYGAPPFGAPSARDREPSGNIDEDIVKFVRLNRLETRVEEILRDCSPETAREVMGLSGGANTFELKGDVRNPTAVVMTRVKKARDRR